MILTLTYSGECPACVMEVQVIARKQLARDVTWQTTHGQTYAVECPCCGGAVWLAGNPEGEDAGKATR